jgi:predicted O-methyltransferase YrrM
MAFEDVMTTVMQMLTATDAVAAVGAELSLRASGENADPAIEAALASVSAAAGVDLEDLDPQQQMMLLNVIRLFFRQAADLLDEPARGPGWRFTDPVVLESIGRSSMAVPALFAAAPELQNVTSFLDVGVGVGWLAVGAANRWPAARVVGIDIWEPALERARVNVRDAGLDDRVELRNQDVTTLDERDAYDCAWVPTFFIGEKGLPPAVAKVVDALRPGGWIVLGRFEKAPQPLAEATATLRTIRGGGAVLETERATELLRGSGCTAIRVIERSGPMPIEFVIGQKPS